jgi:hypothetical protein
VRKCPVRLSDGRNKMAANLAAILFLPFESQTNRSSPDHLIAGPFESRTQKVSERWPFECRIIRLSDVYCSSYVMNYTVIVGSQGCLLLLRDAYGRDLLLRCNHMEIIQVLSKMQCIFPDRYVCLTYWRF